ncbi:MAG: hypothetical protein CMD20_04945 [Flavobacteriales bacterium]|nr:hypothetical protein [Flavobacteriales bacterium]
MENVYIYFAFIFIAVAVIAYPKMKVFLEPKVKSYLIFYSVSTSILLAVFVSLVGYYFIIVK